MREKIADILKQSRQYSCNTEFAPPPFNDKPYDPNMINVVFPNKILTLISEEIEKVENTHLYFGSPHTEYDIESNRYHSVFEQCRIKILALLR